MLTLVRDLVAQLDARGVRWCHWKSNVRLEQSVRGETDLDLLVDPSTRDTFEEAVTALGFVVATPDPGRDAPAARHYFGLDAETGTLVHLDVLGTLVTGGTLAKPYQLPLMGMVWGEIDHLDGIPVTSRAAELALLMVRKYLEAASPVEYPLLRREWPAIQEEFAWLTRDPEDARRAGTLIEGWLSEIPTDALAHMVPTFREGSWAERRALGRRIAYALRHNRHAGGPTLVLRRGRRLGSLVRRKLTRHHAGLALGQPAPLVAFVGPKAAGKSTLIEDTRRWLAPHFDVRSMHAGRPPSSMISAAPNALLPLARRLLPRYRHSTVSPEERREMPARRSPGSALFVTRSVLLAHDKRRLIERAARQQRAGSIVISDRYPLPGPDGPLLDATDLAARGLTPEARAARWERSTLAGLPAPDVVVSLRTDVESTVQRNRERVSRLAGDDEATIRLNHQEHTDIDAARRAGSTIIELDTSGDLPSTVLALRRALWAALVERGARRVEGTTSAPILAYYPGQVARGGGAGEPENDVLRGQD